jgi:hypothetical protein
MKRMFTNMSLFILTVAISWVFPFASWGQVVWTTLGPYGGQVYDIAIDPTNPEKMFAGSYLGDGLFLTTDGGNTWQAVEASNDPPGEATFKNHAVWSVKIAPSDSNVIWVAHNYWVEKSLDGGKTWIHIWNGTMQGTCTNCPASDNYRYCYSLAVDPSSSDTVYVGTGGAYSNYYNMQGAIYRTEDGGVHWTKLNGGANFDYQIVALAIDASNPDYIYIWAVTNNGGTFIEEAKPGDTVADGSLYRGEIQKATGAENWTKVFSMYGGKFYDVKIKPNDPTSIFTANDWGIFRHYFEGGQWNYQWILNLSTEPPAPGEVFARNVRALAFDPSNPDILYAAWKNSHSKWPGIDTRSKVARGLAPYENVNWDIYTVDYQFLRLAVHPLHGETLFGGELARGVFRSADHGQTWSGANNGINALLVNDVDVDPYDKSHLLAGTTTGVWEKKGAGDWVNTSSFEYTTVNSVAFDPTDDTGATYYAGTQNYLAKTTNHGGSWTLSDPLPNDFVTDIAIGPGGNTVFITTEKAGGSSGTTGVYRSEDGLTTPTLTMVLSSNQTGFNVVMIDPNDSNHVFAGSGSYFGTPVLGDLYESTAGGDAGTWQFTGLTRVIVNALLIDPRNSNVMYAGCGSSGGTDAPLYKSVDGGATWVPAFDGIPSTSIPKKAVWGTSGADVFIGGDSGSILRYDGKTLMPMRSSTLETIYNFWGTSNKDIFGVGADGLILHFDGVDWSTMSSGTIQYVRGVWGASSTNVYAAGNAATLLHYDGNAWNVINVSGLTTSHFRGAWGSSANDVFVCGYSGTILHYDGNSWTKMDTGTGQYILGLWGTSGTNIFAVGGSGTILHYDGNAWCPMTSPTTQELQCVWGANGSDVFAVGATGTILHYDGNTWATMGSGITSYIWRVWGSSGTDVFAVGDGGVILHYDGKVWVDIAPSGASWNSVTDLKFHPKNKSIIYASTTQQGVYVSPNEGGKWLNLGIPEYQVNAISTGSLYAATQAGLLQCTGTGVVAGGLTDRVTGRDISGAIVFNDLDVQTMSVNGEYMMVTPVGIFSVTAVKDGYANKSMGNVRVYGGDVSWANMSMEAGVSDPTAIGLSGGGDVGGGG